MFPKDLLDAVLAVAAVGTDQPRGNLVGTGAPGVKPAPLTVPMDAEATAIFDGLDDEMTRRQRVAIGSDQSAALARVWENAAKVALIKAVSANPSRTRRPRGRCRLGARGGRSLRGYAPDPGRAAPRQQ